MKDNVEWVKCVLCVVYQVDLSLQFVAMCYSVGLPYEREISQIKIASNYLHKPNGHQTALELTWHQCSF